jgi:hypothetical protein
MTLAALLAVMFIVPAARADVPPDQVPSDLKLAIEQRVTSEGHAYAGLCRAIDQATTVGKYCVFVITLTSSTAEVSYGPVLSEPVARVNFAKVNGQWTTQGQPNGVPSELREAIKKHVEGKGHVYAGLCSEIAQDGSNLGKYCASVSNLSGTAATVSYGPVASNAITTLPFEKRSTGWAAGTPATVTPKPPATGTGTAASGGNPAGTLAFVVLGVGLALVFGLLSARGQRTSSESK